MMKYQAEKRGKGKKRKREGKKGEKKKKEEEKEEKRRKKEKKKEEKEGIEGNREQRRGKKKGEGLGKERLRKKIWFGEKFVQKKYLGEKNGLWENLYSPFRFGEKKCLREKGGGNDKFGKYIALIYNLFIDFHPTKFINSNHEEKTVLSIIILPSDSF